MLLTAILIGAALYTAFGLLLAKSAGRIDALLGTAVYCGLGGLIAFIIWLVRRTNQRDVPTTPAGLAYSVLAGVLIAVFSVLLIRLFERNDVSYIMPTIYGGVVALTAVAGWLLFHEKLGLQQAAGIFLIVAGITLVAAAKFKAA